MIAIHYHCPAICCNEFRGYFKRVGVCAAYVEAHVVLANRGLARTELAPRWAVPELMVLTHAVGHVIRVRPMVN